ncbi:hypothetical protein ACOSP7_002136 [Xanthoceras sorbifolium]
MVQQGPVMTGHPHSLLPLSRGLGAWLAAKNKSPNYNSDIPETKGVCIAKMKAQKGKYTNGTVTGFSKVRE